MTVSLPFRILLLAFVALLLETPTYGTPLVHTEYSIAHGFELTPSQSAAITVASATFNHTWVKNPGITYSVAPPAQPIGFNTDGLNFMSGFGVVRNYSFGGNVNGPIFLQSAAVPSSGVAGSSTSTAFSVGGGGEAKSSFNVSPFGVGTPLSGLIQSNGFAERQSAILGAYAFSSSQILVRGPQQLTQGRIRWSPRMRIDQSGRLVDNGTRDEPICGFGHRACSKQWDPIFFQVLDLDTGDILAQDVLAEIIMDDLGVGRNMLSWDSSSGVFEINAQNANFNIDINSPFTVQQGSLDLQIRNGLVTVSEDSGLFDGLLPGVGQLGAFDFSLGDLLLDYNLGSFTGHNIAVSIGFAGAGTAFSVDEPATLLLAGFGLVGLGFFRQRRNPGDQWRRTRSVPNPATSG